MKYVTLFIFVLSVLFLSCASHTNEDYAQLQKENQALKAKLAASEQSRESMLKLLALANEGLQAACDNEDMYEAILKKKCADEKEYIAYISSITNRLQAIPINGKATSLKKEGVKP